VAVILIGGRVRSEALPWLIGLTITAAYWFTASTSFANPAVTVARALSDTFAGIAPSSVPLFIAGQVAGALAAVGFFTWLFTEERSDARRISDHHLPQP
jgi:glycerol uptake facilitator-like aquaporin